MLNGPFGELVSLAASRNERVGFRDAGSENEAERLGWIGIGDCGGFELVNAAQDCTDGKVCMGRGYRSGLVI